ncbi:hypothetical protein JD844_003293 [Phrynosoma platyrhinos]|uniref:Uncharacterized protein n=1 Tax=Phrynosoma platyrhinos TaxID=52577 RepID=A0ABQ7TCN4_PHRPL|nr:hypothetical protein JD844_003293 [Phrynosoma platyrhinos]
MPTNYNLATCFFSCTLPLQSKITNETENNALLLGIVRLSELKMLAQTPRCNKANVNISDHIITQRDKEEEEDSEDDAAAKHSCDSQPMGVGTANHQDPVLTEARHRKRKTISKASEITLPVAKETTDDKCRGRRQKDFDSAEQEEYSDDEARRKERHRSSEDLWTQNQQKLLEIALQQYPKGTAERWDKIAKYVPGKSKEECMARYKLLVELIQKKKMAKS